MSDLASRISALEDQLENLRRQKMIEDEAAKRLTPDQQLAIQLHEKLCTANHTDGCGWHYEIRDSVHDWAEGKHENWNEHSRWLGKARKVSAFCKDHQMSTEDALALISVIRGY